MTHTSSPYEIGPWHELQTATVPGPRTHQISTRLQRRLWLAILVASDTLMLGLAFEVAFGLRFRLGLPVFDLDVAPPVAFYRLMTVVLTVLWLAVLAFYRLYDWSNLLDGTDEYARLADASTTATVLVIAVGFLWPSFIVARGWLLSAWILAFVFTAGSRFALRLVVYRLRRSGYFVTPALVIGLNDEGQALAAQLAAGRTSGLRILGFVGDDLEVGECVVGDLRVLCPLAGLPDIIQREGVEDLVIAQSAVSPEYLLEIMQRYSQPRHVRIHLSSGLFGVLTTGLSVRSLGCVPLIDINPIRLSRIEGWLKGLLDYCGAFFGFLLLLPVLIAIAIAIRLDSPGPIVYRRRVLGRGGKPFDAYKFRTMHENGDALLTIEQQAELQANHKLKDDPRVTHTGKVLRKYSLDELPQLVNVLRGQMSLIGPRMITPAESNKYGKWATNLLTVKPGLSGLWQVSGRSDIGYDERVQMDMYYIRNYSIWLDLQLILRTLAAVTTGRGAY